MDEFEKRLKRDALDISVDISPPLTARIEASLLAAERIEPLRQNRSDTSNLWWASSLRVAAPLGGAPAMASVVLPA